jgi:hypothetical protein
METVPESEGLLRQDSRDSEDGGDDIALHELTNGRAVAKSLLPHSADDVDSPAGETSAWTEAEEKRLVRKLDFLIMPLLIVAFFALQLDRGLFGPFERLVGCSSFDR